MNPLLRLFYTARSLVYMLYLYLFIVIVACAGAPFAIFSRQAARRVARIWAEIEIFGARWICGIRIVVEGTEYIPTGPALVAVKHQSMLDTIVPFKLLDDPTVVAKYELTRLPFVGWYIRWAKLIPVDRGAHIRALKDMARRANAEVATGRQLVIFPEGTRRPVAAKPPAYKPGIALLYRELGVPCTPVALNTGYCWPAHGVTRTPGLVTIRFLPPIPPGLPREEFMHAMQTAIETATDALPPARPTKKRAAAPAVQTA
ncbi:MAG: 1-acyl-sn-glycerol-3-phosphate acyltransferase [Hyphomonadaceae bacterium]|nr:1-acyl-sn-glycerol-3-phosphate acyltransferase [Hyphomonadaceae bacterium]